MEHAAGKVVASPDAPTRDKPSGHAAEPLGIIELSSAPPDDISETGHDNVLAPNAPVHTQQTESSAPYANSDNPASSTLTEHHHTEKEVLPVTEYVATSEKETSASGKEVVTSEKESAIPEKEAIVPDAHTQNGAPIEEVESDSVKNTVDEQNDDSKYPGGGALAILTFGLCMATFVVALDNTIIATAIPKITTVFDSLNDVGWYGSSYLLTTTSLQPSFGKVYTYFNIKWTYLSALLIFELGSIVCAAAKNSVMLIVGRAIAGAGAAALFSGGMTIVGYSVALRKRSLYISLLSSMFGISSVVGPILGGVLTDRATWRWCFWINLPFGAVALLTVFFFFKNPEREHTGMTFREKVNQIDLGGAFLLICGIVCLLLALQWGGTTYPWHDSKVWGCILAFGLIISCFVALQFKLGPRATIPPHILTQRTIAACATFTAFLAMGLYAHIYYLPFYFQAVKSTSAEGSGIRTIPYLVSNTLAAVVVGGSITAIGYYTPFMWVGSVVFTIGAGLLYSLKVDSYAGKWIGYQLLTGIGSGASVQIPFIAVQVVLSAKDMPSGNALTIFFNTLGGALSVSIAQNIFSNTLAKQIPKHTTGVNPATIIAAGATHVREASPPSQLAGILLAYDEAVTSALILPIAVGGLSFICSLFMEMKSVKGKKLMAGAA